MSKWMQMVAVALAAVVSLVPTFAQLSYAQAVPGAWTAPVLPIGEEMDDAELAEADGEAVLAALFFLGWKLGKAAALAGAGAAALMQRGCDVALQVGTRAGHVVQHITMRGLSFTAQHPLATSVGLGAGVGGLRGGLASDAPTLSGRLIDAAKEAGIGVGLGLVGYGLTHPRWRNP
ncbi:hypothetical protein H5T55_00775 [Candidatus Bipolaricaulota bacterium]|nr:hypothetical protein [Candidatus Bipolaricaulota bacterium]